MHEDLTRRKMTYLTMTRSDNVSTPFVFRTQCPPRRRRDDCYAGVPCTCPGNKEERQRESTTLTRQTMRWHNRSQREGVRAGERGGKEDGTGRAGRERARGKEKGERGTGEERKRETNRRKGQGERARERGKEIHIGEREKHEAFEQSTKKV